MELMGSTAWIFRKAIGQVFGVCSAITLFTIVAQIAIIYFFYPISGIHVPATAGSLAVFFLIFIALALSLVSQIWLWIGMLIFCIRYDRSPLVWRAAAVLLQVIALSLASSLVYILIYRPQLKSFNNSASY